MNDVRELLGDKLVVVTGAGLSAASGIPTFRGPEGYWTVGAREYHPQELATHAAFLRMPREVWHWYLYRRGVCRAAAPNAAHRALVELEERIADRFTLVTQNVDGLHLRAGSSLTRTHEIHGNIDFMRCLQASCRQTPQPIPESVPALDRDEPLTEAVCKELQCPQCGGRTRPHVLWFDECYDELLYRAESSLAAATKADTIITVGTAGATNLPHQIVALGVRSGASLIDINPEATPFSEIAEAYPRGAWLRGTSDAELPQLLVNWR